MFVCFEFGFSFSPIFTALDHDAVTSKSKHTHTHIYIYISIYHKPLQSEITNTLLNELQLV